MSPLSGKKILLGVCGSIAAYKSAFLLRELQRESAEVRVVMTPSATNFVAPLTFSALSHHEVYVEMFPPKGSSTSVGTWHIDLSLWADVMIIAPVTASTVAKITQGIADNFLTSLALALRCPLIIAPAMDVDMFGHPATVSNLSKLRERGVHVVDPESGEMASGLTGAGRLADVSRIVEAVARFFEGHHKDLAGTKILVTAGPTQEPIDAVRFVSNRSSGKMGFAIAAAAANRGADVRLVSGPVALETPRNVTRKDVGTADEMRESVAADFGWCDVLIMAAAVADYRPASPQDRKIKKSEGVGGRVMLDLVETTDILASLSRSGEKKLLVGFALETDNEIENARSKMKSKSLDMIVVNNPREEGAGFGTETNRVTILRKGRAGLLELPLMSKYETGMRILDEVKSLLTPGS